MTIRRPDDRRGAAFGWIKMLGTIASVLSISVALLMHGIATVQGHARTEARLAEVEERQVATDKIISKLPKDYVPRAEHAAQNSEREKREDARDHALERMEDKIDAIDTAVRSLAMRAPTR